MPDNTLEMMPDATNRNQRIVLQHTTGPFAGGFQIMGYSDEFGTQLPPTLTDVFDISPGARKGRASLIKSTPRYLLYRELVALEGLGAFDTKQQ